MKIERKEITIRELADGYTDDGDDGVVGFGGKLDIRPPYQRAFVYKDKQRDDVVRSVLGGFPLNVMYWATRPDGRFEVLDGQQGLSPSPSMSMVPSPSMACITTTSPVTCGSASRVTNS